MVAASMSPTVTCRFGIAFILEVYLWPRRALKIPPRGKLRCLVSSMSGFRKATERPFCSSEYSSLDAGWAAGSQ